MAEGGWGGKPGEAGTASSRRIAGTAVLQLAGRALNVAIGVVAVALLARALGPGNFGVWSTALAFVGIFGVLTDLGMAKVATQRMSAEPDREHEWLGALMISVSVASVISLLITVAAIPLLGDVDEVGVITAIIALTLLTAAPGALLSVFDSRVRAGIRMGIMTVNSVLWLAAIVVLDATGGGVLSFAIAFTAVTLFVGLLEWLVTKRYAHIAVRKGRQLWRPLMKVALPLGLAGVLTTVYYRIDSVLLFVLAGDVEAGVYGAAYRFLDPIQFLPVSLMAAVYPVMSALHGRDHTRVLMLVQRSGEYLVVAALGALAVTISLSPELVQFLLGPGYEETADVLPVLMLAFVFISLGYLAGYLVPIVGLQWKLVVLAAIGAVVNIGLNFVLIPPLGAIGAAWATVACELVVNALALYLVFRALEFMPSMGRLGRAVVAAALTTLVTSAAAPLGLFPALAVAGLTYVGLLLALRVVLIGEVVQIIRREEVTVQEDTA